MKQRLRNTELVYIKHLQHIISAQEVFIMTIFILIFSGSRGPGSN